jgi:two-component system sensor histidine kinase KdpD
MMPVVRSPARQLLRLTIGQAIVGAVSLGGLIIGANPTTIGFAFLLTILGIAIRADLTTALVSSFTATACYNFFYIPPLRTFSIEEPANWVALLSFFVASIVASRLVVRARTQAAEANARRNEVETLYSLSVDLFTSSNREGALGHAAARALANVGAQGGGLVLFGAEVDDQQIIFWSGPRGDGIEEIVAGVGRRQRTEEIRAASGRDVYLPLNLGNRTIGVLAALSTAATVRALESAATLVALAVERERFLAELAHVQAVKEGDALKTSLLRAVSHDLASPLTAIVLQIERLRELIDDPPAIAGLNSVAEDVGRLRRRIENLLAMARLEARKVVPRPEPTPAADLFRAAREHLSLIVENRPVDIHVAEDCPDVYVDPSLALEILVNLIENAHRASPPGSTLELSAFRHPGDSERVRLEVADRGPGFVQSPDGNDLDSGVNGGPSDTHRRGLGLEIARSLTATSAGSVTIHNREGGGGVARIDLPAAHLPAVEEVPV